MINIEFKSNWDLLKERLKQRFANLTDTDLQYQEGLEEELFGRILKRTGQTRLQLEHFLVKRCRH